MASASSPAEAERLAEMVEAARAEFLPLPFFTDRPLRIHFTSDELPWQAVGITVTDEDGEGWISIGKKGSDTAHTVAHELAHFHFDSLAAYLPQLIEEGLCELLGSRVVEVDSVFDYRLALAAVSYLDAFTLVVKSAKGKAWLDYLARDVPSVETALRLDSDAFLRAGERAKDAYYGLGLAMVISIGFEGLCDLATEARDAGRTSVSPDRLLEAAGLEPLSQANLNGMFARAMGPDPPGEGGPTITVGN